MRDPAPNRQGEIDEGVISSSHILRFLGAQQIGQAYQLHFRVKDSQVGHTPHQGIDLDEITASGYMGYSQHYTGHGVADQCCREEGSDGTQQRKNLILHFEFKREQCYAYEQTCLNNQQY